MQARGWRLIFVLALGCGTCQAWQPTAAATTDHAHGVVPFLKNYCLPCHGPDKPQAGLALSSLSADFTDKTALAAWQRVFEQLELGAMPPEGVQQPPPDAVNQVRQWILQEFETVNVTPLVQHKLRSPEFGNHINHEKLFDGSQPGPASSPPRLWRLSPYVYDQFVEEVGRNLRRETAIHQPFPLDAGKGAFADFAAEHFADAATLQLLLMNCQTLVEYQTSGVLHRDHEGRLRRLKQTPPELEEIVRAEDMPTLAQLERAINWEYQLLLSRLPTDAEKKQLVAFGQTAIELAGNVLGLQTMLQAILMKPEAIYRLEIGLGPVDDAGRRRLSDVELAFALARGLTDLSPRDIRIDGPTVGSSSEPEENETERKDAEENETAHTASRPNLLELAAEGFLSTPEQIRRVVKQILDDNNMSTADYRMFTEDHRIGNTRVLRFFREFFGYHHAPKVFKDAKRIGHGDRYLTERMVGDADQFVMHIFDQDQDVLQRLLTSDEYFVAYLGSEEHIAKDLHYIKTNKNDANFRFNTEYVERSEAAGRHPIPIEGPDARQYVGFYNLDHETWDYPIEQPFRLPSRQRAGILTHPAWLIAWSGNFDNDPIRRGKWIREHLLADKVRDVPLDVDAVVPEDPHKSLRERLQVTRAEYCWQCHQQMDPLGLPFQQYDDFGRYRRREMIGELLSIFSERHQEAETIPIDTSGAIIDSGEATLDGEVASPLELVQKLATSPRVRQSFVRHAFRYWMGRNETLDDSPTLLAAEAAYVNHGGSMKALIASLLSSDSFLYRKEK